MSLTHTYIHNWAAIEDLLWLHEKSMCTVELVSKMIIEYLKLILLSSR